MPELDADNISKTPRQTPRVFFRFFSISSPPHLLSAWNYENNATLVIAPLHERDATYPEVGPLIPEKVRKTSPTVIVIPAR